MHCPTLIPSILANPHLDKNISLGILHDLLPRRTSIEIECLGSLSVGLNMRPPIPTKFYQYPKWSKYHNSNKLTRVSNKYGIFAYEEEISTFNKNPNEDYIEHKISIRNYKQLTGLYNILKDINQHCTLNIISGIHIHVDFPICDLIRNYVVHKFFTKTCTNGTMERIFGSTKDLNYLKENNCSSFKTSWIFLNTNLNTIEFRIAPMTFDYSTIVNWMIEVNKLVTKFNNKHMKRLRKS